MAIWAVYKRSKNLWKLGHSVFLHIFELRSPKFLMTGQLQLRSISPLYRTFCKNLQEVSLPVLAVSPPFELLLFRRAGLVLLCCSVWCLAVCAVITRFHASVHTDKPYPRHTSASTGIVSKIVLSYSVCAINNSFSTNISHVKRYGKKKSHVSHFKLQDHVQSVCMVWG